jgi:hypothetical protein
MEQQLVEATWGLVLATSLLFFGSYYPGDWCIQILVGPKEATRG